MTLRLLTAKVVKLHFISPIQLQQNPLYKDMQYLRLIAVTTW
jgi:hypothetical protein